MDIVKIIEGVVRSVHRDISKQHSPGATSRLPGSLGACWGYVKLDAQQCTAAFRCMVVPVAERMLPG